MSSYKPPPKRLFFFAESSRGIDTAIVGRTLRDQKEMQEEEPKSRIVEYRLVETRAKRAGKKAKK